MYKLLAKRPKALERSLSYQTSPADLCQSKELGGYHPISVGISEMCLMTSGKPRMLNWNLQKRTPIYPFWRRWWKKTLQTNEGQRRSSGKPMWELQLRAGAPQQNPTQTPRLFCGFSPAKESPDFWQLELCFFESTSYPAAFHPLQNAVKPGAGFSETTVKPTSWWWKHRVFKSWQLCQNTQVFVSFRFNQTIVFISKKKSQGHNKKKHHPSFQRFHEFHLEKPQAPQICAAKRGACVLIGRVLTSMADNTSGIFASKSRLRSKATGSCVSSQPGGLAVVGWCWLVFGLGGDTFFFKWKEYTPEI